MASTRVTRRQIVRAVGAGLPVTAIAAAAWTARGRGEPSRARDVRAVIDAEPTADGAGVKLRRALGTRALPMLDPFLLLDEIHSNHPADYAPGFPTHPHRGFETVTYVIDGAVDHRDSLDNHGHLGPGSAQWMTAGRGIVHSEMPTHGSADDRLWAFQLWVNLPAALKMTAPRYQDLAPARIPQIDVDGARVHLVAGEAGGSRGPVDGIVTAPVMLDVGIPANEGFSVALDPAHNAFVYVIEGQTEMGPSRTPVSRGQLAVLGKGVFATARSRAGGRMLLFAGRPIGEPVARSGPFVMNTDDELRQAWEDYRLGRLVQG
jgi:quercetin 2,3-dioxygenase